MSQFVPGGPILSETAAEIGRILGADADRISIERVVIGLFFTGVRLAAAQPGRRLPRCV